jgi:hypothetical protein
MLGSHLGGSKRHVWHDGSQDLENRQRPTIAAARARPSGTGLPQRSTFRGAGGTIGKYHLVPSQPQFEMFQPQRLTCCLRQTVSVPICAALNVSQLHCRSSIECNE